MSKPTLVIIDWVHEGRVIETVGWVVEDTDEFVTVATSVWQDDRTPALDTRIRVMKSTIRLQTPPTVAS